MYISIYIYVYPSCTVNNVTRFARLNLNNVAMFSWKKSISPMLGHISKRGNGKGGIRICLPVHCLSARSDRQPYCHTNATSSPCWRKTKLRATIACQHAVGTSRCGNIVLRPRSPRKCHYPLFAYPLFKRALHVHRLFCHYLCHRLCINNVATFKFCAQDVATLLTYEVATLLTQIVLFLGAFSLLSWDGWNTRFL